MISGRGLSFVLALVTLIWSGVALGVGQSKNNPVKTEPSLHQYARDLVGDDVPRRTYAGRVLLRQVRVARRVAARRYGDPMEIDSARQALLDYDKVVAPKCINSIGVAGLARPCILILELLETESAIPALEQHLNISSSTANQRLIRRAIATIQAVAQTP
jgi:hypothetical protein